MTQGIQKVNRKKEKKTYLQLPPSRYLPTLQTSLTQKKYQEKGQDGHPLIFSEKNTLTILEFCAKHCALHLI